MIAALLNSRRSGKGVTIDLAQIEGTAAGLRHDLSRKPQ
jgi:crotonobetainyl-CoA:carnitine CoA-transferase CaiB-like acyl-CoA transferase